MTLIPLTEVAATPGAPAACALSSEAFRRRTVELASVARRALLARERIDGGERLTFRDDAAVERELRTAVVAEASCCSFLAMCLVRRDGALSLDVTGPDEAQPIIAELFA